MDAKRMEQVEYLLAAQYGKTLKTALPFEKYTVMSQTIMAQITPDWQKTTEQKQEQKRACYFSAEFLMGRAIFNNLYALGELETSREEWEAAGLSWNQMEEAQDAALGNGGLGRLAACYLDSAAAKNLPLDGYGIRYQYGLFRQDIFKGFQMERPDNWAKWGDPWSVRREEDAVDIFFAGQRVKAVPYDMPVLAYRNHTVNTLRLWQCEPVYPIDLQAYNDQDYPSSAKELVEAQVITQVLYPNDTKKEGKQLRLKQQYFFTSASLQDILRKFKEKHGHNFVELPQYCAIQLNDTHPVLAIPELVRLLLMEEVPFDVAMEIAGKVFSYTNHTVMAEAMEKWNIRLFQSVLPHIYQIIADMDSALQAVLTASKTAKKRWGQYRICWKNEIHMARLASFVCHKINGVARLHTEILKDEVLAPWNTLYPGKIINITNGITPRRWAGLCNPQLSAMLTRLLGSDSWLTDLSQLKKLEPYAWDDHIINEFNKIKFVKKQELSQVLSQREQVEIPATFLFDIQIKRFHEYKRQVLNALSVLAIYFRLKEGKLEGFHPAVFIFGGKAAPGYQRAKAVIKLIHEIAYLVNEDPQTNSLLQVVFATNYDVSYAEKLIPAADVSEQISTAGTEASGTGNMKLMLNGAVTLGTMDGANIEIVEQAGRENNYIFGASAEEIKALEPVYDPKKLYESDPELHRLLDAMTDGTLNNGSGVLGELKESLLEPTYNRADHYFVLQDFQPYLKAKLQANRDYGNALEFGRKCWRNLCSSGYFSSDRSIETYAQEIWEISPLE